MIKILIAPDKFKNSLTASQVCDAVEDGITNVSFDSQITKIPLADGGEGSLTALESSLHFKRVYLEVSNPKFKKIKTYYGLLNNTAYIEMALASGLQLLKENERHAISATSLGTGELILDALKKGAKKIYLFIGGSATNDAGIGIASALGYKFIDKHNNILKPIGESLSKIKYIDTAGSLSLDNIEVNVLTDVNNPLFGENGAAYVFAEQKGASAEEVKRLDNGLRNFSQIIKNTFGKDVSKIAGSGAAGGVGAGAIVFCNAKIKSGINTILDLLNINSYIQQSDLVITGEGLLDRQTLQGKVVKGVMDRCKLMNKPLAIVCGDKTLTKEELDKLHVTIVKSIKTKEISKEDSIKNAYSYLVERSEELVREYLKQYENKFY